MSILSSKIEGVFVIMPNGRLDTNNYMEAEKLVAESIEAGERKIIFDFSKTDYISSSGLRVILQAAKLLHKDGAIALCNANEQIHEVLEISGFLDMIRHFGNLKEAMAAVSE
ncbi:MAG TPA: anti-sigma factor antagonist [Gammaproteobacteria bacterium]|nr:anti-sigma factor antagonist [Gammaproteobacteria bacterium]